MACYRKLLLLTILVASTAAQWEPDARKRALTRSLGVAAMKMIDYIKQNSGEYDEWLVNTVQHLQVSDGFASIRVPENILELWSVMSEDPQHMDRRIDELTPHNIDMPEEEKLLCAIVTRYVWEKLQKNQYSYDATEDSLTLAFRLTYEELFPPYLAMSEYLSQGRKGKLNGGVVSMVEGSEGDFNDYLAAAMIGAADAALDVDGNVDEDLSGNPDVNPDVNPDMNPEANPEANPNVNLDANSNANPDKLNEDGAAR